MKPEKIILPEENELPFNIKESSELARGGESTVWKADVKGSDDKDRRITLKQVRREEFASDEEMQKSKAYYDYLRSFRDFGKFIPDTLYVKARTTSRDTPRAYAVQRLIEGKPVNKFSNVELYKDPELVRQLLEFADETIMIMKKTREEKRIKPDFGNPYYEDTKSMFFANFLLDPRYSNNIVIADKPDANGQKVFFVDTGANVGERTIRSKEVTQRQIVGRLQEFQLRLWRRKLKKILEKSEPKSAETKR